MEYSPWKCVHCQGHDGCFKTAGQLHRHWQVKHPLVKTREEIVDPKYGSSVDLFPWVTIESRLEDLSEGEDSDED